MTPIKSQQVATMTYTRSDFPEGFLFGAAEPAQLTHGLDSYRFALRWIDILMNANAIDRLERNVDRMLEHGLRPCLVLDHTTFPDAIEDIGGWRNRDTVGRFSEFSEAIMARLGDRLFSVSPGGFVYKNNDPRIEARCLHHQLLAHGRTLQMMRSYGMTNLGIELGHGDPDLLEAVINQNYAASVLERLGACFPEGWSDDLVIIAEPVDWCGVTANRDEAGAMLREVQQKTQALPLFVTLADGSSGPDRDLAIIEDVLALGIPVQGIFLPKNIGADGLQEILSNDQQPAPWVQAEGNLRAHWTLVADIGGTNTRLGIVTNGELTGLHKHPTGTLADLREAIHTLRDEVGTDPRAVVAAGAGPVQNGTIRLTNANLDLSEVELSHATGAHHTFVINDFTAAAWSVAEITDDHVETLQGESSPPMGTRLVVGPGTGLGVGALLYSEGHFHTVSGEGGHIGLSPRHHDEVAVFDAARHIAPECFFDDSLVLEAEMFLSGTGLPILYQAVAMAGGQTNAAVRSAKDILQDALDGMDPCAVKTARMFTEHLGAIMGDLAMALVPTGGVFLVGGVAEKNRWLFGKDFLRAFNAGGRFEALRQGMNLYVSEQEEFGIVGANNFCKNALAR